LNRERKGEERKNEMKFTVKLLEINLLSKRNADETVMMKMLGV
jgi:hypothetical protein